MKRLMSIAILGVLVGISLNAQSTAGWKLRADRSTSASDPDAAGKIQFMAMGGGSHAVNPQAAVYWHPKNVAEGNYTLRGTFTSTSPVATPTTTGWFSGAARSRGRSRPISTFSWRRTARSW